MIKDYMRWVIGVIESENKEAALHILKHENFQGAGQFFLPHLAMAEDNECLVFIKRLAQFNGPDHPAVDYIAKAYEDFTKQSKLAPQDQDFYPLDILIALGIEGKTLLGATIRTHEQFAQYGDTYNYGLHEDLAEFIHSGKPTKAQIKQIVDNFQKHYEMFRDQIIMRPELQKHLEDIGVDIAALTSPRVKKSQFQDLYDSLSKQSTAIQTQPASIEESRDKIVNLLGNRGNNSGVEVIIRPVSGAVRTPFILKDQSHDPLGDIHNGRILQQGLSDKLASFRARQEFEKVAVEMGAKFDSARRHIIFSGPPGTGKSTLAADIGDFFFDLGTLAKGHVYQTTGTKTLGAYVGQTAPLVRKAVSEALGGILLIDEIYQWADEPRYGHEAVNELLDQMERHRDNLIVIVAGYKNRVMEVLNMNPGLLSRFSTEFEFTHFTREELSQILDLNLNKMNLKMTPDAHDEFVNTLEYEKEKMGEEFANARRLEGLLDHTVTAHSVRWQQHAKAGTLASTFGVANDEIIDILTMTGDDVRAGLKLGVNPPSKRRSIGFGANLT